MVLYWKALRHGKDETRGLVVAAILASVMMFFRKCMLEVSGFVADSLTQAFWRPEFEEGSLSGGILVP